MINNIQALRAFAAINVVVFHTIETSASYSQSTSILGHLKGWGANGVDIFFVISGFVMLHSQLLRRRSPREFIKNRIIRIVPTYWLITAFFLPLFIFFPSIFREMVVTPIWVLSSLFFSSSIITGKQPIVHVGWTLEWEMLFYLIFSAGLLLRSWTTQIACISISLTALSILTGEWIVLEFLLGMFAAHIHSSRNFPTKQGTTMLCFGALLLLASITPTVADLGLNRTVTWGVPSFFIVLGAIYSNQIEHRMLSYIGDASYAIYLVQTLTIPAFYKLSNKLMTEWSGDVLALICITCSVFFGCLFYSAIEKPLTLQTKRWMSA